MENLSDYAGFDCLNGVRISILMSMFIDHFTYIWGYKYPDDYPRDCNPKLLMW